MKPFSPLLVPALIGALAIMGCHEKSTRSDYPDNSPQTKAQANALHQDAERRDQVIERDLQQRMTTLGFEEKQVVDKAKQDREQIVIDHDQTIQPLKLHQQEARAAAEREEQRINSETNSQLATVNGEEATRIKTAADSKVADSRRSSAEIIANDEAKIAKAQKKVLEQIAKIDEQEAVKKAEIVKKRSAAERQAREDHLKVSVETTDKLDGVGKDSAVRVKQERTQEQKHTKEDARITAAVRDHLDRQGEPTKGVTVTANDGVVALTGVVSNETARRELVTATGKIDGVVRVNDQLAIR
jgi:osmotically-inducible protein OsmY